MRNARNAAPSMTNDHGEKSAGNRNAVPCTFSQADRYFLVCEYVKRTPASQRARPFSEKMV